MIINPFTGQVLNNKFSSMMKAAKRAVSKRPNIPESMVAKPLAKAGPLKGSAKPMSKSKSVVDTKLKRVKKGLGL